MNRQQLARRLERGLVAHLTLGEARPGGSYRLCPCGWWHLYDVACPTGDSDPLTAEEFAQGCDRE